MTMGLKMVLVFLATSAFLMGPICANPISAPSAPRSMQADVSPSGGMRLVQEGGVLCCWTCPKDGVTYCKKVKPAFCDKWGREVTSCSQCD